ncbi:MAG: 5'-3' exonuclease [Saccharofermentanales bacterium]
MNNESRKLLIIDGHNLMFQMFFGMPSRIINKDGKAIQGTLGFVGALLKIIRMIKPTHVVVLFDGEHDNVRAEVNADYKANRIDYSTVPDEECPFTQMPDICAALAYLDIKHIVVDDCETDDVIAAYAIRYCNDIEIVISSFDSDFFQLINENVTILRYRGDQSIVCDTGYIIEKLGILPGQYADYKSLTGDNADNIKGAYKIGPKTAAQLICQFGCLTDIIENAHEIVKTSIKASIQNDSDRLLQNYKIIKLDDKAKQPFCIDDLEYNYNGITTNEVLNGIGLR